MLTIARTFAKIEYHAASPQELGRVADATFVEVEEVGDNFFPAIPHGTEIKVRDGSVEVIALIVAGVGAVITAISAYGTASDGLKKLIEDSKRAASAVRTGIRQKAPGRIISTRISAGHLDRLNTLLSKSRSGELSNREAALRAIATLENAGETVTAETRASIEEMFRVKLPPPQRSSASSADAYHLAPSRIPGEERSPVREVEIFRYPGQREPYRIGYKV